MQTSSTRHGRIWIAQKRKRGVSGEKNPTLEKDVAESYRTIDVTSGSCNKLANALVKFHFSPMYLGPVIDDKNGKVIANIFENYWQGGKVFKELGHVGKDGHANKTWEGFRNKVYQLRKGHRHPPGTKTKDVRFVDGKGRKHYRYSAANFAIYDGKKMDYIESRKKVYAPKYAELVKETNSFTELKKLVDQGENILIIDVDGPPDGPKEVTLPYLQERVNDPSIPFGHGYVVAGLLAGISETEYCDGNK